MIRLAATIVRLWVRLYTMGLETTVRERIRQEVEADLWEQMNSDDASGPAIKEAGVIFLRLLLGIPADIQRITEEPLSMSMGMEIGMRWATRMMAVCIYIFFYWLGVVAFVIGVEPSRIMLSGNTKAGWPKR